MNDSLWPSVHCLQYLKNSKRKNGAQVIARVDEILFVEDGYSMCKISDGTG